MAEVSAETTEVVLTYLRRFPRVSVRQIGTDLHIGRTTANRAVQRLVATDRLVIERPGTGHLYPTTYRVL